MRKLFIKLFGKKAKPYTAVLEIPVASEGQQKYLEACLQSPRLILALKDVVSASSEIECVSQIADKDQREGAMEAFRYIRKCIDDTLGKHKTLIE